MAEYLNRASKMLAAIPLSPPMCVAPENSNLLLAILGSDGELIIIQVPEV
jgi:hypothetical protein